MDNHLAPPPLKRPTKIILTITTILYLLLLVPAFLFALMSPFAFDSGATEEAFEVFYFLISFPFVLLMCLIVPWVLYRVKWYIPALVMTALPMVYGVGAVIIVG